MTRRESISTRRGTRARVASFALFAGLATAVVVSPLGATPTDEPAATETVAQSVDETRATLEKWVETRRIISKERQDWALGRQTLSDRIDLVQREIDSLRAKIAEAEKSITEADRKREELVQENERLKEASGALGESLASFESRTRDLLARSPDPIRERVKPLSQGIPADPAETKLSLSARFQNVVGILNEVNKFNREITVTSEVRSLPGGALSEVAALYVGIGQGYYVNGRGDVAGVGTATKDGWVWRAANEAAADIARAIAVFRNEQVAEFVKLPVLVE